MLKRLFVCALMFLCASGVARATILIQLESGNPKSDGAGGFFWNYDVFLEPGAFMSSEGTTDKLVIYDVGGLNAAKSSFSADPLINPADVFAISEQNSGPPPGFLPHKDTSALPNLVLELSDGPVIRQTDPTKGSLRLGTLTVDSTFGTGAQLDYGSIDRHTVMGTTQPLFAVSSALGPVPEPSTVAMMAVGLGGVLGVALRRRT